MLLISILETKQALHGGGDTASNPDATQSEKECNCSKGTCIFLCMSYETGNGIQYHLIICGDDLTSHVFRELHKNERPSLEPFPTLTRHASKLVNSKMHKSCDNTPCLGNLFRWINIIGGCQLTEENDFFNIHTTQTELRNKYIH